MAKLSLSPLANLQNQGVAVTAINNNSDAISAAVENTLSRDGTTPNTMSADLDMNSNDVLNVGTIGAVLVDAETVEVGDLQADTAEVTTAVIETLTVNGSLTLGPSSPGAIQGPVGPPGSAGATGATGPAGSNGATGPTGATGAAGSNGTNGTNGTNGQGVPTGGTANQVLSKIDSTNYNTQWTATTGSGSVVLATSPTISTSLAVTGPANISPTSASTTMGLNVSQSGPTSGSQGTGVIFNEIHVAGDQSNVSGNANAFEVIYGFGGSNTQGQRSAITGFTVLNSATSASNPSKIYTGISGEGQISSADGGTDTSTGSAGSMLGLYASSIAAAGATNLTEIVGQEINTSVRSTASTRYTVGQRIAQWADNAVSGAELDAAQQIINQSGAVGWNNYGIVFDTASANAGTLFKSGATMLGSKGSMSLTNGIDISSATFSGNAFKSTGFTVDGSGNMAGVKVTPTGLLDISGASAGQISFPATQNASAGVNVLDDYEEGTWTPTFVATGCTFSYAEQFGSYTKIGNLVTVWFRLTLNTTGNTLAANGLAIGPLPFTSGGTQTTSAYYIGTLNWNNSTSAFVMMQPRYNGSAVNAVIVGITAAATSTSQALATTALHATNATNMVGMITYHV